MGPQRRPQTTMRCGMHSWPFTLVVRKRPTYVALAFALGALHLGCYVLAGAVLSLSTTGPNLDGTTWRISTAPNWNVALLFSSLFTYLILIAHFILRGARADCIALQNVVGAEAANQMRSDLARMPPLAWVTALVLGVSFWAAHMQTMGELTKLWTWFSRMPGYLLWVHLDAFLFWLGITSVVVIFVRTAWLFYRLGLRIGEIDPLDIRALRGFSQSGPRMTLCLAGSLIVSLVFVGFQAAFYIVPVALVIGVSLALFLLPLLPVRRRIRAAREAALDQLEGAMSGDYKALAGTRFAEANSLVDLVTLRQALENSPTWPISHAGWWRFAAYALLPTLSWGASWVIDLALDKYVP